MTQQKKIIAKHLGAAGWTVAPEFGRIIAERLARTTAVNLAGAINREVKAATFRPKNAGRRARNKGHGFEREVAQAFRPLYPEARRHLEYQDSEANGVDLVGTGLLRIQCKRLKGYAPVSRLSEIEYDPIQGEIPVLVTAADGEPALAVLPLNELLNLLRAAEPHFSG